MTSQQKAVIAVQAEALYSLFAEQAKAKQAEYHGNQYEKPALTQKIEQVREPAPKRNDRTATAKVAQTFGTNRNNRAIPRIAQKLY